MNKREILDKKLKAAECIIGSIELPNWKGKSFTLNMDETLGRVKDKIKVARNLLQEVSNDLQAMIYEEKEK